MNYVVETESLCKDYGRSRALCNLSMKVPKGAVYGFVGANGAGKTTLIRLLCGLQEPTAGSYTLYGVRNREAGIGKARRRIGAVVETPSVYLDMTAAENIRQQYQILGLPDDRGADDLLELVGLRDTGKKKVRNFSLGMRQRLGIAVALAGSPDCLILDEPTNGLDPQGIIDIRELILRLNREQQITVMVSSHILDELSRIATHYGFIAQGRLIREITAEELEQSCRRYTVFEVDRPEAFALVCEAGGWEYRITEDRKGAVYGDFVLTDLILALKEADCGVLSFEQKEETLESYYMNMMGGGADA